jgi:hypothetical protein
MSAIPVILEFSLRITSIYELAARRRLLGAPVELFWSHGYYMERGPTTPDQRLRQWPRFDPIGQVLQRSAAWGRGAVAHLYFLENIPPEQARKVRTTQPKTRLRRRKTL